MFYGGLPYGPRSPEYRCGECEVCARGTDGHDPGDEDRSER